MFQCHSPKSSHPLPLPEFKRLLYTSVSLLLSCVQGYCYHLSKFHIYVLVYCIGVFLSGLQAKRNFALLFSICGCSVTQLFPTVCDPMDCSLPTRLLCPWNFPRKNTWAGCHFLLQGIFPIQGSNLRLLCLLHWQTDSLSHLGSPNIPNYKWLRRVL